MIKMADRYPLVVASNTVQEIVAGVDNLNLSEVGTTGSSHPLTVNEGSTVKFADTNSLYVGQTHYIKCCTCWH